MRKEETGSNSTFSTRFPGLKRIKLENLRAILSCFQDKGVCTRREIQRQSGCGWATISVLVDHLIKKKILHAVGASSGRGRPAERLELNSNCGGFMGIDIGVRNMRLVLMDFRGKLVEQWEIPRNEKLSPKRTLDFLAALVQKKLVEHPCRLFGVGLGISGQVDSRRGMLIHSPHLQGWNEVDLASPFKKLAEIVMVEHNVKSAALAELELGAARGCKNALCFSLGVGIGMGMILNHQIYGGANNLAGEVGHVQWSGLSDYWEDVASVLMIPPRQREHPDARDLKTIATRLGRGIGYLVTIFDPELVILNGGLLQSREIWWKLMEKSVRETVWGRAHPKIVSSPLGKWDVAIGAAAGVRKHLFRAGETLFEDFD